MRHSNIRTILLLAIIAELSITSLGQIIDNSSAAQAPATAQTPGAEPAQAPAPPPQICGNSAYCFETNDFAATITSFRITTDAAKRQILDLSIRFQNKTNQQLVLGYVNASGNASDDRGNRLVPWGPNASRGLGLVYGATFDPKFVVRPAGVGDAQFEFYPQGYPQVVGFTYTLDISVAEINTFEGNQHTLGEEFPLHFQGLRNGSAGISPGFAPGAGVGQVAGYAPGSVTNAISNPCAAAGNAGGQVASTVSNAANAISSIGSLFKKKKDTQNVQQASIPGCDPNAIAPGASAVQPAAAVVTPPGTNPPQQIVPKAVTPQTAASVTNNPLATPMPAAVPTAKSATPGAVVNATSKAPIPAAAPAVHSGAVPTTSAQAAKPATPAKPNPQKPAVNTNGQGPRNGAKPQ
jgi:hypothetical protein